MSLLENIDSPADLKKLTIEQLSVLAEELREYIVSVVAQNGGHLASNLGVIELTLAIHYVFDSPKDKIIFDVGHQCYAHKILTGRRLDFPRIRMANGPSGFPRRVESEHDPFGTGHASTAISAALGFAVARRLCGQNHKIVAVVGDGSCTGGLVYEGLNQAGALGEDMLIILNDNSMSISKNVGAFARYLTEIISDQSYNKIKGEIWKLTERLPKKDKLRRAIAGLQELIKGMIVPGQIFERLGFRYFGPVDGHDLATLVKTLSQLKQLPRPLLLHVLTKKGHGYGPAETRPVQFHGIGSFDRLTGRPNVLKKSLPYTEVFGRTLVKLADKDSRICAVTAAMAVGTGLVDFAERFPHRFFDVGIAEQHAVTFAAGLAAAGLRPFVAVYSTFLQRAYDQIAHDVALQKLPVVFCLDRAGIVGEDGATHNGTFDICYLGHLPNIILTAPKDGRELQGLLALAAQWPKGPFAIRYPKANIPEETVDQEPAPLDGLTWELLRPGEQVAILAVGSMVYPAWRAANMLDRDGISAAVVNCRFLKPFDQAMLDQTLSHFRLVVTIEEGTLTGGFGYGIGGYARAHGFDHVIMRHLGLPDVFITHDCREAILSRLGLDESGIAASVLRFFESHKAIIKKPTPK